MPDARVRTDYGRLWLAMALVVLAALFALFAVQTWSRAARPDGNDFTGYLLASRALWQGENPYAIVTPFPFIYPLFLCVALAPFVWLPYPVSAALWYVLCTAALLGTLALTLHLHGPRGRPRALIVTLAVVALLSADAVQNNLLNGQVNFLVLALCLVFARCYLDGRGRCASLTLGAAIALKITPAILLFFLLRRREWRCALQAIAAAFVFAVVLPWLVAGSRVAEYYSLYARTFLAARLATPDANAADPIVFSLVGIWRAASGIAWPFDAAIAAGVVLGALAVVDRGERRTQPRAATIIVCLYLAASLLITPMSETHHLAHLLPGLAVLLWRAAAAPTRQSIVPLAAVSLALLMGRLVPIAEFGGVVGVCGLLTAALLRERVHLNEATVGQPVPGSERDDRADSEAHYCRRHDLDRRRPRTISTPAPIYCPPGSVAALAGLADGAIVSLVPAGGK